MSKSDIMDTKNKKKIVRKMIKNCASALCGEIAELLLEELTREKRIWVKHYLTKRNIHGTCNLHCKELGVGDIPEYRNCMRLSPQQFDLLLQKTSPLIQRIDTLMREAIPARIKLEITLSYLATGSSYRNLQQQYRVSRPSISNFIPEVCDAIIEALKDFLKFPETKEEWKAVEEEFNKKWNFPKCYGAIDSRHITIRAPPNYGSEYFNYSGYNSIILLAVVDGNYCFRYIDVGCNGNTSCGGIFSQSTMYSALENGLLPENGHLVGDNAFPLKHYLLTPFSTTPLSREEKIFNYRLSRARRLSENALGILVSRFRVFEKSIACKLSTVDKIVRACCVLHNWLRITSADTYLPLGSVDAEHTELGNIVPGSWRTETDGLTSVLYSESNQYFQQAVTMREKCMTYFVEEGAVPWQHKMIM